MSLLISLVMIYTGVYVIWDTLFPAEPKDSNPPEPKDSNPNPVPALDSSTHTRKTWIESSRLDMDSQNYLLPEDDRLVILRAMEKRFLYLLQQTIPGLIEEIVSFRLTIDPDGIGSAHFTMTKRGRELLNNEETLRRFDNYLLKVLGVSTVALQVTGKTVMTKYKLEYDGYK